MPSITDKSPVVQSPLDSGRRPSQVKTGACSPDTVIRHPNLVRGLDDIRAYDAAAIKRFGEFATLNFPNANRRIFRSRDAYEQDKRALRALDVDFAIDVPS
jgi:hypothetical protein